MATQRNEPGRRRQRADFRVHRRSWQKKIFSRFLRKHFAHITCWTFKGYLLLTYLPLVQQSWFLFLPLVRSSYHLLSYLRHPHFLSKTFPRQLDGSLIGNYWLLQQLYLTSCKTLLH
jgi:hypothetical protein